HAVDVDAFLEQVFVDVDQSAAREDPVEFVAGQLVIAGAATYHHGLDIQVVKRGGQAVEEHAVVGDHLLGLVFHAVATLRVAAAQIAGGKHGLYAGVPQHGLRGQSNL